MLEHQTLGRKNSHCRMTFLLIKLPALKHCSRGCDANSRKPEILISHTTYISNEPLFQGLEAMAFIVPIGGKNAGLGIDPLECIILSVVPAV